MTGPQRKAQIVDVVLRLVNERGVGGTTTARIARAAGVTEPTLYQYFESRRDMLLAALDVVFDRATEVVESSHEGDAVERLRKIGEYHTRETKAKQLGFVNPLFEFVVAPPETGLRDRVRLRNLVIIDSLAAIVEEGKAQGRIRADVDAKRVAWRVMGFYWFEDVSSLMDLGEVVSEGITEDVFAGILADITASAPVSSCDARVSDR
jgi:AcrR family transcriptional regulator